MAFENFPYTNFHEINLDWIIEKVKEAYSASNPPDYPVKSVNGMTGDVIIAIPSNLVSSVNGETGDVVLYRNPLTQFPATDEQRWNLFRICNGDERGIEFDEDGAHRIEGTRRILIYDAENQPDYPVTSVNGQTGDVRISAGVNSVNGKTGNVVTPFINPNTDILKLDSNSNTVLWGISRDVAGGNVALYITTGGANPQAFIRYIPTNGNPINLPLLTNADIPSDTGVISINTKTGVVLLYATDIYMSEDNSLTISAAINKETQERHHAENVLESAIFYDKVHNSNLWSLGAILSANGENDDTRNDFIRINDFIPNKCNIINCPLPEYFFRLYAWDENNTYMGVLHTNNTFAPNSRNLKYLNIINFDDFRTQYPGYKFKVTFQTVPDPVVMDISDANYITLLYSNISENTRKISEIAQLAPQIETILSDIDNIQDELATFDNVIQNLQTSDATHTQQISALQADDSAHAQQIASLQSADATHDQQISALQAKETTQDQQISELYTRTGVYGIFIENVNSLPLRYPATGTDAKIKSTNMVVGMDLYISGVQVDAWTITTYDGYLEITGTMNGTSSMTLYLA